MSNPVPRTRIEADSVTYLFDADAPPVRTVEAPARLTVAARDAYNGACDPLDVAEYLKQRSPGRMNPCTGPIGVCGAAPGDTLAATIDDIRVGSRGHVATPPGTGLLGDTPIDVSILPFDVAGDTVTMAGRVQMPLRPMVGTIGVAPASGAIETLSLGSHGGNLDINEIRVGTTVYLPVRRPEALFAIGDVHSTMGDGEIHSGVNTAAEIDLSLRVFPGEDLEWPWLETSTHVMTVGVGSDLAAAARMASEAMERLLVERGGVARAEARALLGAAVDLRLGQAGGYGVPVSCFAMGPKTLIAGGTG